MSLRRPIILLMNLCLLLSLSAQALAFAQHPCMADARMNTAAPVDHAGMDHGGMNHGDMDHSAMDQSDTNPSQLAGGMECCEGADECSMDQCVLLPASLVAADLQAFWLAGVVQYNTTAGIPLTASFPPYHPPFLA